VSAVFYVAHAALHVFDTLRGAVELHHVLLDFPGVYLPAIVLPVAARIARRREGAMDATRPD